MATQKYPATSVGVYFTAIHIGLFAVAHTFNGMAMILVVPYLPADLLWTGIGGGDSWVSTAILAATMLISLLLILYLMYPFGKDGYRKRTYVIVMTVLIFIVHPLAFYLYSLITNFYFVESSKMSDRLMTIFPVSSLAFVGIGSLIDRIVLRRMAVSRSNH